jgi:ABC-2 type transport system permease protein
VNLFFLQLGGELRKLFGRKRTYIGFGAFLAVELMVLILFQRPKVQGWFRGMIERAGYGFEYYFSGLTLALLILMATFLLTMLYLALVGGDIVSKEVEDGIMRMVLCRPVSRVRILLVKYCACVLYTFALIFFIGTSALLVGIIQRGTGGLFVMAPEQKIFALYDMGEGLIRFYAGLFFYAASFLSITTLGFALSCCNMKPAAATIVTLSVFVVDWIFHHLPYFESIKDWFITKNMASWANIFRGEVPVASMIEDYAYLLGVNGTLVILGIMVFQCRDFKS